MSERTLIGAVCALLLAGALLLLMVRANRLDDAIQENCEVLDGEVTCISTTGGT